MLALLGEAEARGATLACGAAVLRIIGASGRGKFTVVAAAVTAVTSAVAETVTLAAVVATVAARIPSSLRAARPPSAPPIEYLPSSGAMPGVA